MRVRLGANSLTVRDAEILRYLGYAGQDIARELSDCITNCKNAVLEAAEPRFVYEAFELDKTEPYIKLVGTVLELTGNDVRRWLAHSDYCIVVAATIGAAVDRSISNRQRFSITEAVIMDAAAGAVIESVLDEAEKRLKTSYSLTPRFSCGYGDFPLNTQSVLLSVLDAGKAIGLFCNESNILTPRKSVTAIMGISGQETRNGTDCTDCLYNESCIIKRSGGCKRGNN